MLASLATARSFARRGIAHADRHKHNHDFKCSPRVRGSGFERAVKMFPGHIARRSEVCYCGTLTVGGGLSPDPNYVPAKTGSAREVLNWIELRLPKGRYHGVATWDQVFALGGEGCRRIGLLPPMGGGATITAAAGGGNWNATGTWTGAVVPLLGDDVILASTSGNVSVNTATVACRSLDCQATGNYAGTLSTTSGSTLTIGTSTVNGTLALRFSTTMTWSPSSATTLALVFASTSATQIQITTAGVTMQTCTFNQSGSYLLADSWTMNALSTLTFGGSGTLDTNSLSHSWGIFSCSGGTARSLTLGTSSITITGTGTAWGFGSGVTNVTLSAASSTITFTGASPQMQPGEKTAVVGLTYGTVIFTATTGCGIVVPTNVKPTFGALTITGPAVKTFNASISVTTAGGITVTGAFTFSGPSTINRPQLASGTVGSPITISAGTVSLTNVDLEDITGAGAATWSGTSVGDCGGNSGITFTSPVTRFRVGAAGNYSDTTHWSTTHGGSTGASFPLPQDTANIDSGATGTVSEDMPRTGTIDFTGFTGTFSQAVSFIGFGNITVASGMTFTAGTIAVAGRGSQTITSSGKSFTNLTIATAGGTYTLQDDLSVSSALSLNIGTLTATTQNVTAGSIASSTATTRTLNMGSGTWTATGTGTVLNFAATATVNPSTSTIVISDTSSTAKTLTPGTLTYNNISITGGGTGSVTFGQGVFNNITINPPKTVLISTAITQVTCTTFTATGSSGNLITINSTTGGTPGNLVCASGLISCDWLSLKDSAASGGALFFAGPNSVSTSGNSGWIFGSSPIQTSDSSTFTESTTVSLPAVIPSVSVSESVAASETLAELLTVALNASDAATATESKSAVLASLASVADNATATETLNELLVAFIAASESATGTESVTVTLPIGTAISVSDSATVSETLAELLTAFASVSDSATATESKSAVLASFVAGAENVTTSESIGEALLTSASVSDSAAATESDSAILAYLASKSESVTASESTSESMALNGSASESVTTTETLAELLSLAISRSDSATATESESVNRFTGIGLLVADSFASSETLAELLSAAVSVSEAATATETRSQVAGFPISKTELVTAFTAALTVRETSFVSKAESTTASESVSATDVSNANCSEASTVAESVSASQVYDVPASESVVASETLAELLSTALVSVADSATASDLASALWASNVSKSEASTATETKTVQVPGPQLNVVEFIAFTDTPSERMTYTVSVADSATHSERLRVSFLPQPPTICEPTAANLTIYLSTEAFTVYASLAAIQAYASTGALTGYTSTATFTPYASASSMALCSPGSF